MAEESADPLRFLSEKLLCPKCENLFDSLKQLPCLHSVCLSCLGTLRRTRGQHYIVACPCCQQECRIESGKVEELPNNPYVASVHKVAHIMTSKLSRMSCAFCDNTPSTLRVKYCFQCEKSWCGSCFTRHNVINFDHDRLIALEDMTDAKSPLKPRILCKETHHEKEEVKLFCIPCGIAVCSLCIAVKHQDHKKEVLKATAEKHKSQMRILIAEQLTEAKKKMDEVIQIDKECEEISSQETEVEKDVITFFDAITECLEEKKKKILTAVKDESVNECARLKRQKKLIQNQGEVIKFAMEATEELLAHSTSVEIIDLKKSLDEIVQEVKKEEREHCDPERRPLQMKFVKAQEVLDNLKTKGLGVLQIHSETSAEESSVKGIEISEAFAGLRSTFTLTTKNAQGNLYCNKRDKITVEVKDKDGRESATKVHIQDDRDGTYKISYFAKEAGECEASVKTNEEHVRGSPFRVKVKAREFKPEMIFGKTYGENTERWGLAVSDDDEIAMTYSRTNTVQLFESDMVTMLSFTKPDNRGKDFDAPTGIAFDKTGSILVADSANGVVHEFSRKLDSREYEYQGRKFGEKGDLPHQLDSPHGLSIDKDNNIIVADTGNKLIKIFNAEGEFIGKIGHEDKNEKGSFTYPVHCVKCDQYFIVSDTFSHSINVFDFKGTFLYQFGKQGSGMEELQNPGCLAIDKLGQLLVCDKGNNRVQIFQLNESNLKFVRTIGKKGKEQGEFEQPFSVGVLSDGRIVVNDVGNKRMQKIA